MPSFHFKTERMNNVAEKKVLNLKELIQNKVKYERKDGGELVTLHIPRLEADISIETPSKAFCMDVIDMAQDEEQKKNADAYMVYSVIKEPDLKDKALQQAYDCQVPTDIVEKIFTLGEIADIVNISFESVGIGKGSVSVVDEVKK